MAKRKSPEKVLSEADMRKLESAASDRKIATLEVLLSERDLQVEKLKLKLQSKLIEDKERELISIRESRTVKINCYIDITNSLRARFKVGEAWGYDPLSGEIKE